MFPVQLKRNGMFNSVSVLLCFFLLGMVSSVIDTFILFHFVLFVGMMILIYCHDRRTLMAFTIMTVFQNLYLIIFSASMGAVDIQLPIIMKEFIVYVIAVVFYFHCFLRRSYVGIDNILLAFLFLVLLLAVLRPGGGMGAKITALRQICIPSLCILFGNSLLLTKRKVDSYFVFFYSVIALFCLLGLCIYILPDDIWNVMNYDVYYFNKNNMLYDGSFANFYSYDFGPRLKRFVSITADPIATAHLLYFALVYLLFSFKRRYLLLKLLVIICCIFCFSKTLILMVFSTIILMGYLKIKTRKWRVIALILILVSLIFSLSIISLYLATLETNTAAGNHLMSLMYGLNNNTLFGDGLGTAGFNVISTGGDVEHAEATESFFAILISQIGILGTFVFYGFLIAKIYKLITLYRRYNNHYILPTTCLLVGVTLESLVSGSSITMLGTGLYFVMSGIVEKLDVKSKENMESLV